MAFDWNMQIQDKAKKSMVEHDLPNIRQAELPEVAK